MSTTTEPGRIDATISSVTSFGAGRPGTAAVVITQSAARHAVGEQLALAALLVLGELLRVLAGAGAVALLLHLDLDELGAEALDLLLDGGADVVSLDHRAEALRGGDRLKARRRRRRAPARGRARRCPRR